jgi:hypothetical protein
MQSLRHQFETFCRSKPRDEPYNFCDAQNCALTQFAREFGYDNYVSADTEDMPADIREAIHPLWGEWTFGALADRLSA